MREEERADLEHGEDRSRMRWLSSKSSAEFDKRNKRKNSGVLGKGGTEWKMAATSLQDDVLLDIEECHK